MIGIERYFCVVICVSVPACLRKHFHGDEEVGVIVHSIGLDVGAIRVCLRRSRPIIFIGLVEFTVNRDVDCAAVRCHQPIASVRIRVVPCTGLWRAARGHIVQCIIRVVLSCLTPCGRVEIGTEAVTGAKSNRRQGNLNFQLGGVRTRVGIPK